MPCDNSIIEKTLERHNKWLCQLWRATQYLQLKVDAKKKPIFGGSVRQVLASPSSFPIVGGSKRIRAITSTVSTPNFAAGSVGRNRGITSAVTHFATLHIYAGSVGRSRGVNNNAIHWNAGVNFHTYSGGAGRNRAITSVVTHLFPTIYTSRANAWCDEVIQTAGAGLTQFHDPLQNYSQYCYSSTPAINDALTLGFMLAAGSYNLYFNFVTSTNAGIVSVYIDGVLFGTIDTYTAGVVYNAIISFSGVSFVGSGYHVITMKTTGKNASSTNYFIFFTKLWVSKNSDTVNVG